MTKCKAIAALPGLLATALLAVACRDSVRPEPPRLGGPRYQEEQPPRTRHLEFATQPTGTGSCLDGATIQVVVSVNFDDDGSTDTDFGGEVTLTLGNNAGFAADGTLNGTTGQTADAGVATFTDLCIDQYGPGPLGKGCLEDLVDVCTPLGRSTRGYTLVATAQDLESIESDEFAVAAPF